MLMSALSRLLPAFQRRSRPFEATFGVALDQVLAAITEAQDDPVAGEPHIPIAVSHVGYTRRNIVLEIDDPFGSRRPVQAVAAVRMATAVPASRRGVHMSRIGDALARSLMDPSPDLM